MLVVVRCRKLCALLQADARSHTSSTHLSSTGPSPTLRTWTLNAELLTATRICSSPRFTRAPGGSICHCPACGLMVPINVVTCGTVEVSQAGQQAHETAALPRTGIDSAESRHCANLNQASALPLTHPDITPASRGEETEAWHAKNLAIFGRAPHRVVLRKDVVLGSMWRSHCRYAAFS